MRTLLLGCLIALVSVACSKSKADDAGKTAMVTAAVPDVSVDQLDSLLGTAAAVAVDANGERTRQKMGIIPGAVLISDSETYLPANELPADKAKPLVFYCANTHCGASHEAADKARLAGYRDVKVLPEGIAGWVKAGKTVSSI